MRPQQPGEPGPHAEEARASSEANEVVLERLRVGDITALGRIFHIYGDRVFSVCFGILANRADAEDATQEVFLRAFQQAAKFSGKSRYSTWLLRLAANHTLNFAKASARRKRVFEPLEGEEGVSSIPPPDDGAIGRERRDELARLLQELPLEQRQVLVMREMEGMSYAELAEALDVPIGTVTSRLIRGREKLRTLLKNSGSDALNLG